MVFTIGNEDRQLKQELKASNERENDLAAKVGVLIVENDWLKKNLKKCLDIAILVFVVYLQDYNDQCL